MVDSNYFSSDYPATVVSSLQSYSQYPESQVSVLSQRLVWKLTSILKTSLKHFQFCVLPPVVEVLADQSTLCQKRYGTKQSLQVIIDWDWGEIDYDVFIYQVHVSTKHRAEKKAQRGRLMGTSDFIVWICICIVLQNWHLMRNKWWIKVYAESVMLVVYFLYLGWCSQSVMLS